MIRLPSRRSAVGNDKSCEKEASGQSANNECCDAEKRGTASRSGQGQSDYLYAVALRETARCRNQSKKSRETENATGYERSGVMVKGSDRADRSLAWTGFTDDGSKPDSPEELDRNE
jgi:hypothetical protein